MGQIFQDTGRQKLIGPRANQEQWMTQLGDSKTQLGDSTTQLRNYRTQWRDCMAVYRQIIPHGIQIEVKTNASSTTNLRVCRRKRMFAVPTSNLRQFKSFDLPSRPGLLLMTAPQKILVHLRLLRLAQSAL